ncbi:MAG: helix-turn-helix transcriptional regulator [Ferruginibacter sp.]|nr:helix-turn-helix transcriptional regulator [Cytophagales bacterium]
MDLIAPVGQQIRDRRQFLRITQGDLAEIAGVSLRSLIDIERGKGNPGIHQLMKILDVLGLKIEISNKG